jgi:hypothetical protein
MKASSQRQIRKRIVRHMEETFDLKRLEYKKRVTPLRHAAKVVGVAMAAAVYAVGFGLAYYAWKSGRADYETFVKFSWIFMIPSSVVGAFGYMLNSNRREFGVAKDILDHMDHVEGPRGMLWRYEPVLRELYGNDAVVSHVLAASRKGSFQGLEPEDYAAVVQRLHADLSGGEASSISEESARAFEANLAKERP